MKKITWFLIIVFLAIISFWRLGDIPRGFDGDEAAIGYYAYSLLKTGGDEFGNKLPLYFKSIGDYKYPGYSYLSTIPVFFFGLNVFSARFLSALAGIVFIIFLIKTLALNNGLPEKKRSLLVFLGVLVVTLSPWYLVFSRAAREANLALGLTFISFYFLNLYLLKKRGTFLALYFVLLALAGLTYPAYRLFGLSLSFGLGLVILLRQKERFKDFFVAGVIYGLIIGLLSLNPLSRVRATSLLFTTDRLIWDQAQTQINEVGLAIMGFPGIVLARMFDNKLLVIAQDFFTRYVKHFDFSYLFINGNPNLPWYAIPKMGLLLYISAPLIILGLVYLFKNFRKNYFYPMILWWLIVSPISSALTVETPNPIRNLITFPALAFVIFFGLKQISELKAKTLRLIVTVLAIAVVINGAYSAKQFFIHREYHRPWHTDQGKKEIVEYALGRINDFDKIVMPDDPYIFFLFYGAEKFDWTDKNIQTLPRQWDSVASIDNKIYFLMPIGCPKVGRENVLYLCRGTEVPQNAKLLFVSRFNDGLPAYSAIQFIKLSEVKKPLHALPDRLTYMVETDARNDGVIPKEEDRLW